MTPTQIAPHVFQFNLGVVNAYAITTSSNDWVLVDTGTKTNTKTLENAATFFGKAPLAILLTHGHLDHAGSARDLAQKWGVKIYASAVEKPFLTGKSIFPPADPTVRGALALFARITPWPVFNLTGLLETIPETGVLEFLPGWKIVPTPGHTFGHVSLWHEAERILIAGDAICTVNADCFLSLATQKRELARPGSPFTSDWESARHSIGVLADLEPVLVAAGHGQPLVGGDVPQKLREFFHNFQPPKQGRYVETPAKLDENGRPILPPAPADDFGKNARLGALAAFGLAIVGVLLRRKK